MQVGHQDPLLVDFHGFGYCGIGLWDCVWDSDAPDAMLPGEHHYQQRSHVVDASHLFQKIWGMATWPSSVHKFFYGTSAKAAAAAAAAAPAKSKKGSTSDKRALTADDSEA